MLPPIICGLALGQAAGQLFVYHNPAAGLVFGLIAIAAAGVWGWDFAQRHR